MKFNHFKCSVNDFLGLFLLLLLNVKYRVRTQNSSIRRETCLLKAPIQIMSMVCILMFSRKWMVCHNDTHSSSSESNAALSTSVKMFNDFFHLWLTEKGVRDRDESQRCS